MPFRGPWQAVTTAVMNNAEESARLLAKLSLVQDPHEALKQAVAKRNEGLERLTLRFGGESATRASSGGDTDDDGLTVKYDLYTGGKTAADRISTAAAIANAQGPIEVKARTPAERSP